MGSCLFHKATLEKDVCVTKRLGFIGWLGDRAVENIWPREGLKQECGQQLSNEAVLNMAQAPLAKSAALGFILGIVNGQDLLV